MFNHCWSPTSSNCIHHESLHLCLSWRQIMWFEICFGLPVDCQTTANSVGCIEQDVTLGDTCIAKESLKTEAAAAALHCFWCLHSLRNHKAVVFRLVGCLYNSMCTKKLMMVCTFARNELHDMLAKHCQLQWYLLHSPLSCSYMRTSFLGLLMYDFHSTPKALSTVMQLYENIIS
jgi:hypothetical protein